MKNSNTYVAKFLIENADAKYVSFHMPGHKGSNLYKKFGYGEFLEKLMDCDITEVIGADNLFKAEGIIKEAQDAFAKLYGVKQSYLLVNGTSGGLIAAIMATVPKGGKLVMARNCHKSIFNALSIADIRPVYAYPEMIEEYGITGEISSKEIEVLLEENPDASAVILPSPNYYGICSDIESIAKVVHEKGKVLIVDQAHGAHLKFFGGKGYPKAAEECGADIVVNSIHKTLAAFTQSALLNLCSDRITKLILEDKLQMIESSSPSYVMMAGLDIARALMEEHGDELITAWDENLKYAYDELSKVEGLSLMKGESFDRTKINLDMSALGLNGSELELELLNQGIRCELVTGNILMCMTGIGNSREDFEKLVKATKTIATSNANRRCVLKSCGDIQSYRGLELCGIPKEKEVIKLKDGAGKICASSIIPYPPGIPIACPGERLTAELVNYVEELIAREEKVIGVSSEGEIIVGRN